MPYCIYIFYFMFWCTHEELVSLESNGFSPKAKCIDGVHNFDAYTIFPAEGGTYEAGKKRGQGFVEY